MTKLQQKYLAIICLVLIIGAGLLGGLRPMFWVTAASIWVSLTLVLAVR